MSDLLQKDLIFKKERKREGMRKREKNDGDFLREGKERKRAFQYG